MGNYSNYALVLGVKLNLEKRLVESNPNWKGFDDKTNPSHRVSKTSMEEYERMTDEQRCQEDVPGYAYGTREIRWGYVLPDGSVVESLEDSNVFASDHECDTSRLSFIHDDGYLGDDQLLGVALLYHSTSDGYREGDESKLLKALGQKEQVAEMINKHGFNFTPEDIGLHQYIMVER